MHVFKPTTLQKSTDCQELIQKSPKVVRALCTVSVKRRFMRLNHSFPNTFTEKLLLYYLIVFHIRNTKFTKIVSLLLAQDHNELCVCVHFCIMFMSFWYGLDSWHLASLPEEHTSNTILNGCLLTPLSLLTQPMLIAKFYIIPCMFTETCLHRL